MKRIFAVILTLALVLSVSVFSISLNTSAAALSDKITDTSDFGFTSIQMTEKMLVGYNIGNLFEMTELRSNYVRPSNMTNDEFVTYKETLAGNVPVTEEFIKYLKASGVQAIRLPVTWFNALEMNGQLVSKDTYYASLSARREFWYNGSINAEFMARVKQVVNWIIENDMYCILNSHHDGAVNNANAVNPVRFGTTVHDGETYNQQAIKFLKNIWTQIGEEFKDYGSKLLFEPYNEVGDDSGSMSVSENRSNMALEVTEEFLKLLRSQGGNNANRFVVSPAYGGVSLWQDAFVTSSDPSKKTLKTIDSANDKLILTTHTYTSSGSMYNSIASVKSKMNKVGVGAIVDEIGELGTSSISSEAVAVARNIRKASDDYKVSCFWWDNGSGDFSITNRQYNIPSSDAFAAFTGTTNTAKTTFTKQEAINFVRPSQSNWVELYTPDSTGVWAGKYLLICSENQILNLSKSTSSAGQGYYRINGADNGLLTYFTSNDGVNYTIMHTIIPTNWASVAWDMFKAYGTTYSTKQIDGNYGIEKMGDGLQKYVETGDNLTTKAGEWIHGFYNYDTGKLESNTVGSQYYDSRICMSEKIDVEPGAYYYFHIDDVANTKITYLIRGYSSTGSFVKAFASVTNGAVQIPTNVSKITLSLYDSSSKVNAVTMLNNIETGVYKPSVRKFAEVSGANRIIAFGDSVVFGDSNVGYGSGNRFGDEHFLNLLGKQNNLSRITSTSQATANGRWFINLAKNGYTIGDKEYWSTTRAADTYNGTIYEDEVLTCSATALKNADTIILDGGVNDFCRIAGWMTSAVYKTTTDSQGNTVNTPIVTSSKTSRNEIIPGETKMLTSMSDSEVVALVNKFKNLKGAAFEAYKQQYYDKLGDAVRSWDEFRNIEIEYLDKIVQHVKSCGFNGNIYFMNNPNPFVNKSGTPLTILWDELLTYCQTEPMQIVADKYDFVYQVDNTSTMRDAKTLMSTSTDYLHLSYLGNREIYKNLSTAIDPEATQLFFDDNYVPSNAEWKSVYTFDTFDLGTNNFKYISGGEVRSISDITSTPKNGVDGSTQVLYKSKNENIVISADALPKNVYGIKIYAFTPGGSSIISTSLACRTRSLSKSGRTNVGNWGNYSYTTGVTSGNCATNSVTGLGSLITVADVNNVSSITISCSLNSTTQDVCYIDDIMVLTTDDVIEDIDKYDTPPVVSKTTLPSGQTTKPNVPTTTKQGVVPTGTVKPITDGEYVYLHTYPVTGDRGTQYSKEKPVPANIINANNSLTLQWDSATNVSFNQFISYMAKDSAWAAFQRSKVFTCDVTYIEGTAEYVEVTMQIAYYDSNNVWKSVNVDKKRVYREVSTELTFDFTNLDVGYFSAVLLNVNSGGVKGLNINYGPIKALVEKENPSTTEGPHAVTYGDVNNDGVVNHLDRLVLSRTLAGWDNYPMSAINTDNADVNNDKTVNAADRLILCRHLAKWEEYATLPYVK